MQRILDLRITKWYLKLAYVAALWLVGYVLQSLLELAQVPAAASNVVGSALSIGGILIGARIFRGRHELVLAPRPWWRMTARRPLSVALGILAVVCAVASVGVLVRGTLGYGSEERSLERLTLPGAVTNILWWAVLAYLYLNSASRIGGRPPTRYAAASTPVVPAPRSTAAIVQDVARVLQAHGLSEQSPTEIVRTLLVRGSVGRSDISDDGTLVTDAAWRELLRDLNATMPARR